MEFESVTAGRRKAVRPIMLGYVLPLEYTICVELTVAIVIVFEH